MRLIERALAVLFPATPNVITHEDEEKDRRENLERFLKFEVTTYADTDPLRPMGYFDSWAGKTVPKNNT